MPSGSEAQERLWIEALHEFNRIPGTDGERATALFVQNVVQAYDAYGNQLKECRSEAGAPTRYQRCVEVAGSPYRGFREKLQAEVGSRERLEYALRNVWGGCLTNMVHAIEALREAGRLDGSETALRAQVAAASQSVEQGYAFCHMRRSVVEEIHGLLRGGSVEQLRAAERLLLQELSEAVEATAKEVGY